MNLEGGEKSIDVDQVSDFDVNEPIIESKDKNNDIVIYVVQFDDAKTKVLDNWKQNIFTKLENTNQTCWVCSLKSTPNGIIIKARLVVREFKELTDDIQTDLTICTEPLWLFQLNVSWNYIL